MCTPRAWQVVSVVRSQDMVSVEQDRLHVEFSLCSVALDGTVKGRFLPFVAPQQQSIEVSWPCKQLPEPRPLRAQVRS
jgi:hypothetical protein